MAGAEPALAREASKSEAGCEDREGLAALLVMTTVDPF